MSRRYVPRPYGAMGTAHILDNPRSALWATPGVGKTIITLDALNELYKTETAPTLVLATLRVARNTWATECRKWDHLSGLDVVPIVGTEKARREALTRDVPIYTTNYENLVWLTEYWGARWPYKIVVADEATKLKSQRLSFRTARKADGTPGKTFLAGEGGKRAAALARVTHSHVKRFIQLTGTPSPNGLKDLWGQLWYLDAGKRLGRTHTDFMARWFEKGYDGYEIVPKAFASEQIHAAIDDLCLTIDAKDYFPLKDPVMVPVVVELPPAARQLYRRIERHFFAALEDRSISAANSAVKTQKLLQVATGAVYVDPDEDVVDPMARKEWREVHDVKIEALDSLIEEFNGEPCIVIYEFWSDLQRLQKAFPKGRVLRTQADEDDFRAGKIPILFVHPKSGGHGIDGFQYVCNRMVFLSHSWNLEEYLQVVERIGPTRQYQAGLDRNVFLYFIIAEDTVDEDVMARRESKRAVQDILMEATKRRETGLPSRARLRQIAEEMI